MSNAEPSAPRLVAVAGSLRAESLNRKLLAVGVQSARAAGAEVDVVELRELELPPYDGDLEAASGLPVGAVALRERIAQAQGLLIASPEYNHSIPGTFKNALDWASRGEGNVFRDKSAGLMGASPGGFGAMRAQLHLRQVLLALGVWLVPGQVTVSRAREAFAEDGSLRDPGVQQQVDALVARLVEHTARMAAG